MSAFSQALKAEIIRVSRKEIRALANPVRGSTIVLKKSVADLKRRVASLESDNKRLLSLVQARKPAVSAEEAAKARFTAANIRKLRTRLGISQDNLAKLLGVSSQAVFSMEHKKAGRLKLRPATLAGLLAVRGLGKREVARRLEELNS